MKRIKLDSEEDFKKIARIILRLDDYIEKDLVLPGQVKTTLSTIQNAIKWINEHKSYSSSNATKVASVLKSQKAELRQDIQKDKFTSQEGQMKEKGDELAALLGKQMGYKEKKERYLENNYKTEVPKLIKELEDLIKSEENKK